MRPLALFAFVMGIAVAPLAGTNRAVSRANVVQDPGWYSRAQADSGAALYGRCATCHGVNLEGAKGHALAGEKFFGRYGGKPLSKLWEGVTRMPPTAPGSIPQPQELAIVAYILQRNGLPAGGPASTDASYMARAIPSKPPRK